MSTEQANRVIEYTIARLESILDQVKAVLANGDARPAMDILSAAVGHGQGATITALPQYVLLIQPYRQR